MREREGKRWRESGGEWKGREREREASNANLDVATEGQSNSGSSNDGANTSRQLHNYVFLNRLADVFSDPVCHTAVLVRF